MHRKILVAIIIIFILIITITIILELDRYLFLHNFDISHADKTYHKRLHVRKIFGGSRYVVSLSTIPDRINLIKPTLISILTQTVRVDEIAINIPYKSRKGDMYYIPKWLKKLHNVKIHRVNIDEGPATKILPTLRRENKNTRIIVIDDDVIYNSNTIKRLVCSFNLYKGKCAITNFGLKLNCGKLPNDSERINSFFRKSRKVDLLQGFSGFLVTPKMFSSDVFDMNNAPLEVISVDDIWLSGWLSYNGISIRTSDYTFLQLPIPTLGEMRKTTALGSGENKNFVRDLKVIKWFIDTKSVFV